VFYIKELMSLRDITVKEFNNLTFSFWSDNIDASSWLRTKRGSIRYGIGFNSYLNKVGSSCLHTCRFCLLDNEQLGYGIDFEYIKGGNLQTFVFNNVKNSLSNTVVLTGGIVGTLPLESNITMLLIKRIRAGVPGSRIEMNSTGNDTDKIEIVLKKLQKAGLDGITFSYNAAKIDKYGISLDKMYNYINGVKAGTGNKLHKRVLNSIDKAIEVFGSDNVMVSYVDFNYPYFLYEGITQEEKDLFISKIPKQLLCINKKSVSESLQEVGLKVTKKMIIGRQFLVYPDYDNQKKAICEINKGQKKQK
jgi:hypothetical protein